MKLDSSKSGGVGNVFFSVSYACAHKIQRVTGRVGNVGNTQILRFLRFALLVGTGVGNVGNAFRLSYVSATPAAPPANFQA